MSITKNRISSHALLSLDLLRHGETGQTGFRGRLDDPLTPHGWANMLKRVQKEVRLIEQRRLNDPRRARRAKRSAQNGPPLVAPWNALISSPKRRCADFARALAGQWALPLIIDARFAELDFGDWEGRTAEEIMRSEASRLADFWNDPWVCSPPGGETMDSFEHRIRAASHDLTQTYAGQRVLLVTHGGVIRLLLCLSRGLARRELLNLAVPHASMHRLNNVGKLSL